MLSQEHQNNFCGNSFNGKIISKGLFNWVFLSFLILFGTNSFGQDNLTLSTISSVPQSYSYNLGKIPKYNFFVGAPYISNVNTSLRSSPMTLNDLGLTSSKAFFDQDFAGLSSLGEDQSPIDIGFQLDLLNFGYRFWGSYFTLHISEQIDFNASFPGNFWSLLDGVNTGDFSQTNNSFDLSNSSLEGIHYRTFELGFRTRMNEFVSFGVNAKYLKGVKIIASNNRGLSATGISDNPFFNLNGQLDIFASGLDILSDDEGLTVWDFLQGSGTGHSGFALDFGVNIAFTEKFELFGTIMDLGKISWTQSIGKYSINAQNNFSRTDIEAFNGEVDRIIDNIYYNEEVFDTTISTKLVTQGFFGGYLHLTEKVSVGAVTNARINNGNTSLRTALTLNTKFSNYVEVATNVSFGDRGVNIGGGFVFTGGPLQLYLVSDHLGSLISYGSAEYIHFNGGINLVFGAPKFKKKKKKKKFVRKPSGPILVKNETPVEPTPTNSNTDTYNIVEQNETKEDFETNETSSPNTSNESTAQKEENNVVKEKVNTAPTNNKKAEFDDDNIEFAENVNPEDIDENLLGFDPEDEPLIQKNEDNKELDALVEFNSEALDNVTNEHLTGIVVEFYRVEEAGKKKVLLIKGFYNGYITLHPDRNYTHFVEIRKQGYQDLKYKLTPAEMAGESEINRSFVLKRR